ncbi:hypothetical protein DT075_24660 [Bacillus licheniformis]|nr:hypothetical protein DT075_24660 [Bacillus licheniformis]
MPFAETVKNLSLEGFKYSLNKCHIALGSTLCISNELIFEKAAPRLHIYQAEKDQTDLDLALSWAVGQRPSFIRMFGISGGRADHFLGNLHLLYTAMKQNVKTV